MTPQDFIAKWQRANLSERSAAQQHFLDLCDLLGQPKPAAPSLSRAAERRSGKVCSHLLANASRHRYSLARLGQGDIRPCARIP